MQGRWRQPSRCWLQCGAAGWLRVADDDDAPGDHLVGSEVADRLGERLCCRLDDLPERQRKQVLCVTVEMRDPPFGEQAFRDRVAARTAVAIGHDLRQQAFIRHAVPDPVVEPVART
jgi:hypothetical protein